MPPRSWVIALLLELGATSALAAPPATGVCLDRRPGCSVLFHDPEGRLVAHVIGGEGGEASHALPLGGMVTVLVDGGSEAGGPAFYTVTEVGPGELVFATPLASGRSAEAPPLLGLGGTSRARVIGVPGTDARVTIEHARVSGGRLFGHDLRIVPSGPETIVEFPGAGVGLEDFTVVLAYPNRDHTTLTRMTRRRPFAPGARPIDLEVAALLPIVAFGAIEDVDPVRPLVRWALDGEPTGADAIALIVTWDTRGGEWAILVPPAQQGVIRLPETPPELANLGPGRRVLYNAVDVAVLDASSVVAYDARRRQRAFDATMNDQDTHVRASLWLQKQGLHALP